MNSLINDFNIFHSYRNQIRENKRSFFNISYNSDIALLNGHPNLDNHGEFYLSQSLTHLTGFRFTFNNSWLLLEIEPYKLNMISLNNNNLNDKGYNWEESIFTFDPVYKSYEYLNNHSLNNNSEIEFKQSQILVHYNGIGFSYGNTNHWWSPGFHSALSLSSNAPSQKTYAIGTFKDIFIGRFGISAQMIAMPYKSINDNQLYFSGLKAHVSHHSKSAIISLGFHRTYLSGNFGNLSSSTVSTDSWSLIDAARLVIEPLFGQDKKDLSYTQPGTPGFDAWDELLTGFVKISFPQSGLEVYADVASDDNRSNILDLKAHWDHTLGYMLGLNKFYHRKQYSYLFAVEYLTTRPSNTFNPKFFRGNPNVTNYYSKTRYDYFTYKGRFMGAHSGSSSDDLIFMLGISDDNSTALMSYNKERHGIKSMPYPELKTEYVLSYHRNITSHHTAFITLEYEKIKNFGFIQNNVSISKLIWLGYSFAIQ
jgi:hypothetical protein